MQLFVPDNHAANLPLMRPAAAGESSAILDLARQTYGDLIRSDSKVEVIGGANINSINYKIEGYCLKKISAKADLDYVSSFPKIAAALRQASLPVAEFVPDKEGRFISPVCSAGDAVNFHLCLQHFIAGHFFTGLLTELEQVMAVLDRIPQTLQPLTPTPGQRRVYGAWQPQMVLEEVLQKLRAKPRPENFDLSVYGSIPMLQAVIAEYVSRIEAFSESTLQHIDLHPHNLLFDKGKLSALLDLESFVCIPHELAVGFTLFKLGRKALYTNVLSLAQLRKLYVKRFDLKRLHFFCKVELTRRIIKILELHYLKGNQAWDSDLPKHFCGLKEIDLLFLDG